MSEQEIELLRRGYELLPRKGIAAVAHLLDPEFEVQTAPELPEAGTYRGPKQFEKLLETLAEPFEDIRFEPEQFIDLSGGLVIVPLHIVGRARLSGVPLDIHIVHVWSMRNQKALRLRVFRDQAQVMSAVMRDAYEAFNTGGFETIGTLLDPEVELHEEPEIPDARVRHGPEGVAQYFAEGGERWQSFELEVDQVLQVAEQVIVVTGVMRGRGGLSGADVGSRFGHVYELRNWRAVRMTFYFDPEKALKAARAATG